MSNSNDVHFSNKVISTLSDNDILHLSVSHRCKPEVGEKFKQINEGCEKFIKLIRDTCPGCADSQNAMRCIREGRM